MTGLPSRSLPSAIGSAARALWKSRRLDQLSKRDHFGDGIRHFDAHRAAPRNRRDDANRRRAHRQREIVRQVRELTHLHARRRLDLELRDDGSGRPPDELSVDVERAQRVHQLEAHRVELALARVGVARRDRGQQVGRRQLVAAARRRMRGRFDRGGNLRVVIRRRRRPSISSCVASGSGRVHQRALMTSRRRSTGDERRIDRRHLFRRRLERQREIAVSRRPSRRRVSPRRFGRRRHARLRSRQRRAPARCPTSARIGFQASVAAMSTDASERDDDPRAERAEPRVPPPRDRTRPTIPAPALGRPGGGAGKRQARARWAAARRLRRRRSSTSGRSRDSSRPNSRSACTAGNERNQHRRRPAKEHRRADARGSRRRRRRSAATLDAVRGRCANASATNAPARNTAKSRSAIPRISRLSEELPTGLPLPVWSELGDLSILVDRDDRIGIHGGAGREIVAESRVAQALGRAPTRRRAA